jgi:hypothetical protein
MLAIGFSQRLDAGVAMLFENSQSAADLGATQSPALACHDATPNQIAIRPIIVVTNIAIGIVIFRAPKTEAKPAATETTAMESTTATMTASAAAMTPMGKGRHTGSAHHDSRCADNAEAANGEQSYGGQTARQDIAELVRFRGIDIPSLTCAHTGKFAKVISRPTSPDHHKQTPRPRLHMSLHTMH